VRELPALDHLAGGLESEKFRVIAATESEGGAAAAQPFLDKLQVSHLRVLTDPGGRAKRAFGVRGLPTTYLIASDGTVFARVEGAIDWGSAAVKEFLINAR
jgi:hypothetical protein